MRIQTVTMTGLADNLSDGDQSYSIRLLADNTTSDLRYKYVDPSDVTLKNLDSATSGILRLSRFHATRMNRVVPRSSRCV